MDAIFIENLIKKYGETEVLKEVNLRVKEGEFYALMGPNGSGKTTLVSIIAFVNPPSSGKVKIYGREMEKAKQLIGYVPQENFSSPLLTGRENLRYFARLWGFSTSETNKIVEDLLKKMGLSEDSKKKVSDYSGGMRKRLEIATGLFPGTKILILDEPTTGLDPSARRHFLGLLKEINNEGITILLITHIGEDAELASRVAFLDEGKIIAEDEPEKLKKISGLKNVIDIETTIKNNAVAKTLEKFSEEKKLLETTKGYRIYCEKPEEAIPAIVRSLDKIGCKTMQIGAIKPSLEDVFFNLTEKNLREEIK